MHTPDGMGADRYRERQNMKEAAHSPEPEPDYDIYALDHDSNKLYKTGSAHTEQDARNIAADLNSRLDNGLNLLEEIARFAYFERE